MAKGLCVEEIDCPSWQAVTGEEEFTYGSYPATTSPHQKPTTNSAADLMAPQRLPCATNCLNLELNERAADR
jgi:hypothetical protein